MFPIGDYPNPRGIHSYENAGFKLEGRLREDIFLNGKYRDTLIMSVLRSEWQDVEVDLPVQGRLAHVRIMPAKAAAGLEVQSIELHDKDGKAQIWRYAAAQ